LVSPPTATTAVSTLSLHDALPICLEQRKLFLQTAQFHALTGLNPEQHLADEISQRLAETGGEFASEAGELGFQARTNFAMLHRRSEEHTSELQSLAYLVCRLLLEK